MQRSREETQDLVDRTSVPHRRRLGRRIRERLRGDLRLTITTLCVGFAVLWILPFSLYRFAVGDLAIGLLDLLILLGILLPASHALFSGRGEAGIRIVALVCCLGCVAAAQAIGLVGLLWTYASVTFVFFVLPRNLALALSAGTLLAVMLVAGESLASTFERVSYLASAALVGLFAHVVATRYERQRRKLESLAWIDPLTGAGNRRMLELDLSEAVASAAGSARAPAIAIMDLDHFKRINDHYGHDAGDRVLVEYAELMRECLRKVDRLYRFGGEEFVLLLPATDAASLPELTEELRATVAARMTTPGGEAVTVSIGATWLRTGEHWSHWLGRADAALYRAKHGGRNRVEIDTPASARVAEAEDHDTEKPLRPGAGADRAAAMRAPPATAPADAAKAGAARVS
jgi:diguanylate cyclase (GGDEF)-like protein